MSDHCPAFFLQGPKWYKAGHLLHELIIRAQECGRNHIEAALEMVQKAKELVVVIPDEVH